MAYSKVTCIWFVLTMHKISIIGIPKFEVITLHGVKDIYRKSSN